MHHRIPNRPLHISSRNLLVVDGVVDERKSSAVCIPQDPLEPVCASGFSECVSGRVSGGQSETRRKSPPPPPVQATVNDQKLTEPTPSVAWTSVLLTRYTVHTKHTVGPIEKCTAKIRGAKIDGTNA